MWSSIFSFCIQLSILMVYTMIQHRNMPVFVFKNPEMQENRLNKFSTIVSEVSFFVGNPVIYLHHLDIHFYN